MTNLEPQPPSRKRQKTNELEETENLTANFHVNAAIPKPGYLQFLKTKAEVRAGHETVDVYITTIPTRSASAVLSVVKSRLPAFESSNLQHLRRFVKEEFLPIHLRTADGAVDANDISLGIAQDGTRNETSFSERISHPSTDLISHLFICPVSSISSSDLFDLLSSTTPFEALSPVIRVIEVPLHAPTSAEQAAQWSQQFWPISYKNTNPYGPHPSIVKRAEAEIALNVGKYMSLAEDAARETQKLEIGDCGGCVVVERCGAVSEAVAVAGDGRWGRVKDMDKNGSSNVTAHAVMRAIGMIARKRLRAAARQELAANEPESSVLGNDTSDDVQVGVPSTKDIFLDAPLTGLEAQIFEMENIAPNGYLCVDLDIYVTHEPCVMCSMAILHSRFGRCVFGKRMLLTGALTADTKQVDLDHGRKGLEHGLFWRPSELNWKFLCWEFEQEGIGNDNDIKGDVQV